MSASQLKPLMPSFATTKATGTNSGKHISAASMTRTNAADMRPADLLPKKTRSTSRSPMLSTILPANSKLLQKPSRGTHPASLLADTCSRTTGSRSNTAHAPALLSGRMSALTTKTTSYTCLALHLNQPTRSARRLGSMSHRLCGTVLG